MPNILYTEDYYDPFPVVKDFYSAQDNAVSLNVLGFGPKYSNE